MAPPELAARFAATSIVVSALSWALIGWLAFGELTDIWTWIGASVIFISSFYIVRREQAIQDSTTGAGVDGERRDSR